MDLDNGQHPAARAVNELARTNEVQAEEARRTAEVRHRDTNRLSIAALGVAVVAVLVSVLMGVSGPAAPGTMQPVGWLVTITAAFCGAATATYLAAQRKLMGEYRASVIDCYFAVARLQTLTDQHNNRERLAPPIEVYRDRYRELLAKVRTMLSCLVQLPREPAYAERLRVAVALLEVSPLPHGGDDEVRELRDRFVRVHADELEPVEAALWAGRNDGRRMYLAGEDLVPRQQRELDAADRQAEYTARVEANRIARAKRNT